MERIKIEVFGITGEGVSSGCACGGNCGCGGHDFDDITMDEMFVDFLKYLQDTDLKDQVEADFIDIYTEEIKENLDVVYAIRGGYQLPITAINGKLLFQGGLDPELIVEYIKDTLNHE